jgi:serine/threonine-protein kinase
MADPPAASVRITDCLLRAGGNLIEVAAGRPLDLDVDDAVLAAGGAVVRGRGLARGLGPAPLRLDLRRATVRAAGGLIQLESTPNEPELPVADVSVRDSVLATTAKGDPLVRVDGQDALEALRDRVRWEGHGVAYHRIETYRRDQSAQLGTVPVAYDRPSWEVAVGLREEAPIHGDLRFVRPWDASRPPWALTRADVRLAADSPARGAGADLDRVPAPPSASN